MIEYPPGYVTEAHPPSPEEMRAQARLDAMRRIMIGLVAVLTILALTTSVVVLILIRQTQTTNSPLLRTTNKAAKAAQKGTARIIDCTTPGGECYQRSLMQTAKVTGNVNNFTARAATLASSCAANATGATFDELYAQVYRCVREGLKPTR